MQLPIIILKELMDTCPLNYKIVFIVYIGKVQSNISQIWNRFDIINNLFVDNYVSILETNTVRSTPFCRDNFNKCVAITATYLSSKVLKKVITHCLNEVWNSILNTILAFDLTMSSWAPTNPNYLHIPHRLFYLLLSNLYKEFVFHDISHIFLSCFGGQMLNILLIQYLRYLKWWKMK